MLPESPKTRHLYNFSIEDISVGYDLLGEHPENHTLKAGEIKEFASHIADLLEEKLATRELWKSIPGNKNREKRYKELIAIIRV